MVSLLGAAESLRSSHFVLSLVLSLVLSFVLLLLAVAGVIGPVLIGLELQDERSMPLDQAQQPRPRSHFMLST